MPETDPTNAYKVVGANLSDFIVGEDSFSALEIKAGNNTNNFYYFYDTARQKLIKNFVLETSTSGKRTVCQVTFIEKNGKFTPRIEFSRRNKDGMLIKENADTPKHIQLSSRISLETCHENLWSLIDFIQSLREVEVPRSGLVTISNEDKVLIDRIQLNRDFIQKVLFSFDTPEAQELLIQAKKDDVRNLSASVKQAKNKQALAEIDEITSREHTEHELQTWISKNTWVFGIEYIRKLDWRTIGIGASADFVVESLDGYADIIELKKADVNPLFKYDSSHDSYYPCTELSKAIGQATNYLNIMEEHKSIIETKYGDKVLKPRAKVVIGSSKTMNAKERKALRMLNDSLHNLEILTYDEIRRRAQTIVEVYEEEKSI